MDQREQNELLIKRLIENVARTTAPNRTELDFEVALSLADSLNSNPQCITAVLNDIRKRFLTTSTKQPQQSNAQRLSVELLDLLVKNTRNAAICISTDPEWRKSFIQLLLLSQDKKLSIPSKPARIQLLHSITQWAEASKMDPNLLPFVSLYQELQYKGVEFPTTLGPNPLLIQPSQSLLPPPQIPSQQVIPTVPAVPIPKVVDFTFATNDIIALDQITSNVHSYGQIPDPRSAAVLLSRLNAWNESITRSLSNDQSILSNESLLSKMLELNGNILRSVGEFKEATSRPQNVVIQKSKQNEELPPPSYSTVSADRQTFIQQPTPQQRQPESTIPPPPVRYELGSKFSPKLQFDGTSTIVLPIPPPPQPRKPPPYGLAQSYNDLYGGNQ